MSDYKTVRVNIGIVGKLKLERFAKRSDKSVNDLLVSFFGQKVHCTSKASKSSKR